MVPRKLKSKLHEKQLERTSRLVRDNKMEKIEEKLEESKNPEEKRKLKEELDTLTNALNKFNKGSFMKNSDLNSLYDE